MRKLGRAIWLAALCCLWVYALVMVVLPDRATDAPAPVEMMQRTVPVETTDIQDVDMPLAGPLAGEGRTENGWLQVQGGRLCNEDGEAIQLRGMSSHGLAWYPQYTGYASLVTIREYGANVFRGAMYVDLDPGNYTLDPGDQEKNRQALYAALDNALALDMYAIADWHIMEQGNPLDRLDCAMVFFDALAQRYASEPGVIYEICNEPNGDTTWDDVRLYAQQVIPVIRRHAPDALIIVGTPEYSTDLQAVIENPLDDENVMYTYHYYSNVNRDAYVHALDAARAAGLSIFVSEWGLGGSAHEPDLGAGHLEAFIAYLSEHDISWTNWSLCNKDESFSAIKASCAALSGWSMDDLTPSGQYAFKAFAQ